MPEVQFCVGIDWGSEQHQACIVDHAGTLRAERSFAHGGPGLRELAEWIAGTTQVSPADVGVAIEVPHGPVVESRLERGLGVYALNPKQLDRFRDRFSPAGAKDDRRDARTLADALRSDGHAFRRLDPVAPDVIARREWTRIAHNLTRDRTRLTHRMRQQLWRYFPQFLKVESTLSKTWVLELWKRIPTPAQAQRTRTDTMAKLLQRHRVRRIRADEVHRRLREPAIPVAPGTTEAAVAHLQIVSEQLATVGRQLATAQREMDRLTAAVAASMETPENDPGTPAQRDVAILASLPGVGRTVLATLLAEAYDPRRRRQYHALRCLCGVAPVTRRSGKSFVVRRRLDAHQRLQDAVYHWARTAVQHDPVSHAKYRALRARGHGHARALRSIADRLLAVAGAMLEAQTLFDPHRQTLATAASGSTPPTAAP